MKYSCVFAIVPIVLSLSCNTSKYKGEWKNTTLCIDLLGGLGATTESEYGFSRIHVEFFENSNGKHYVETQIRSRLEIKPITPLQKDSVIFILKLNNFSREVTRDTLKVFLLNGKFIGISKIDFERDTSGKGIKLIPTKIEISQTQSRISFH
jgi:hypothetical protein